MDSACKKKPTRLQPRIAAFTGEGTTEYLVLCELFVLCKVSSLHAALFTTFAAYYCFNLEYPQPARQMYCFFQDYILERPDSNKKSASYLAVVSDIKRNM